MSNISTDPYKSDDMNALVNAELMEKIFYKDATLHARITYVGKQNDTQALQKVLSLIGKPKVLTKRPKSIPINKKVPYKPATCATLFDVYSDANVLVPEADGMGTVIISGDEMPAEVVVVKVLKILLELGIGKDEERVNAVRERLQTIVVNGYKNKMFTTKSLMDTLTFDGYYLDIIDNRIKDLVEGQCEEATN